MKEHIKRVDRILKYKGSILDIYTDVIETPDGHRAEWDYIDHRGAAAVVPVLDDGRLLMVRQYRDALDRETIEIPAGGLNGWDEPTINAAARELEEETGYRSDNLTKLVSVVTAVAFCNEVVDVYLATDLVKTSQHLDEDEFIDVEKYTLDELKDMIFSEAQFYNPDEDKECTEIFIDSVIIEDNGEYLHILLGTKTNN